MKNNNKSVIIKIIKVLKEHNIAKAGLFGSYARGDNKKNSDIDILIDCDESLMTLIGIELELKKALKKRVDLLTYGGISPYLKDKILSEEVRII